MYNQQLQGHTELIKLTQLSESGVGLSAMKRILINPRRACAARVTVLGLSVCLSTTILALQATRRLMSDTNSFSATRARKNVAILLKRLHSRDMA